VPLGSGDELDHLTVSDSATGLAHLVTAGADQYGFRQTPGLHPLEGLLRDFLREVGAADTDIANAQAERFGGIAQLGVHFLHHLRTLVRKGGIEVAQAVHPAKGSIETRAKTGFRSLAVT